MSHEVEYVGDFYSEGWGRVVPHYQRKGAVGWIVATVDEAGILHLDWDGELHTKYEDAERQWAECLSAHWKSCLLRVEYASEIRDGDPFDE